MSSFKNLEMAAALSRNQHIAIKRTLFGLSQKAVYEPTQSTLQTATLEYAPEQGARLESLLALPKEKLLAELKAKGCPTPTPVGQYRLEACISADRAFAALQLFRFADFNYKPVSELLTLEGDGVAIAEALMAKS